MPPLVRLLTITESADDILADEEFGEKRVCVALDGQEAELTFIDHPSSEMSVR